MKSPKHPKPKGLHLKKANIREKDTKKPEKQQQRKEHKKRTKGATTNDREGERSSEIRAGNLGEMGKLGISIERRRNGGEDCQV
jgi:hypothetical protein